MHFIININFKVKHKIILSNFFLKLLNVLPYCMPYEFFQKRTMKMNKNCKYVYWSTSMVHHTGTMYLVYMLFRSMYGGKFPLVEKTNTNSKQFTHGI